ncbi:quinol dehydrogenase ferredoxin subunit NapH [Enterobacillus tribolii]|uniref:Ferredoxin-type protein NapH n=1 Tax=Enterobacillus tribolii TaxID=1487935 RepID=A0A370QRT9_9GAMM|nr:quinol dehydrogenase ferredoxin subunit NapH [Enterobacillus tribolii]MBW7983521.1 quinol dehydrogenase ferredoxin subunit NapH [Enterobacillus tribolii]RDK91980.1 ferredoxin-type protein NapH [Enterobacillus tribolii]
MANSVRDAGREARLRKGWWLSHRWLVLRRLSQALVLLMFLSGPLFGVWILKGNYSSSMLLDVIPLTDPLIMLESLVAGHWPALTALVGALLVAGGYSLIASRAFCSWVCPLNPVTDLAAWLRRRLGIRQSAQLSRNARYGILLAVLAGSAVSGSLLWEWLNPVALLGRSLIFGAGAGLWLIVAIFLYDLLVTEHGWCGHLCPIGALYGAMGAKAVVRVSAENRENCNRCMDCFHVCPESQVLRDPVLNKNHSPLVLSKDCISCGRCMDVCAEHVFEFKTRFHRSGAK